MAKFQLGSYEHKKLFCGLLESPEDSLSLPVMEQDEKVRLQSLPLFPFAVDQLDTSAQVAKNFANTAKGSLLQNAIAQLAKNNRQVSKLLKPISRGSSTFPKSQFKGGVADFIKLSHQLNLSLFLAGGLLELAQQSQFLTVDVIDCFEKVLDQQAKHAVFFINWLAFESQVNQKPEYEWAGALSVFQYWSELWAIKSKLNRSEYDDNLPVNPTDLDRFLGEWKLPQLLEASEINYQKRFAHFDERLLRPTKLLKVSSFVRTSLGFWPQRTVQTRVSST